MNHSVKILQRVGIDVDDEHGEQAGDGAALVELASLVITLELPFVPFPGLALKIRLAQVVLEEVVWEHERKQFVCYGEAIWRQTRPGAASIIDAMIEAGFHPPDPHREDEVH